MKSSITTDATLIVNPVSGTGDPQERLVLLRKLAAEHGWKGTYVETTKTKTAFHIAEQEINKGVKHIVVCGGDGTIMEVLSAVLHKSVVIGIVPLGTGNLLARNLDLPLTMPEAMTIALNGKKKQIDVGKANGTVFSIIAGIGLDAQIMQGADRNLKNSFGILAYVVSGFNRLRTHAKRYEITLDKKKPFTVRAKTIMAANMGKMMGGVEIVPETNPQNGKLSIGIVKASNLTHWFSLAFHALLGDIDRSPHYDVYEAQYITIRTITGKNFYQCDGNHFPPTDILTIDIYPKAVTVYVG